MKRTKTDHVAPAPSQPKARKTAPKAGSKKLSSSSPSQLAQAESFGYEPTYEEITLMAQRIYEEEGRPAGRAEAHWLEAERRLRQEAATVAAG